MLSLIQISCHLFLFALHSSLATFITYDHHFYKSPVTLSSGLIQNKTIHVMLAEDLSLITLTHTRSTPALANWTVWKQSIDPLLSKPTNLSHSQGSFLAPNLDTLPLSTFSEYIILPLLQINQSLSTHLMYQIYQHPLNPKYISHIHTLSSIPLSIGFLNNPANLVVNNQYYCSFLSHKHSLKTFILAKDSHHIIYLNLTNNYHSSLSLAWSTALGNHSFLAIWTETPKSDTLTAFIVDLELSHLNPLPNIIINPNWTCLAYATHGNSSLPLDNIGLICEDSLSQNTHNSIFLLNTFNKSNLTLISTYNKSRKLNDLFAHRDESQIILIFKHGSVYEYEIWNVTSIKLVHESKKFLEIDLKKSTYRPYLSPRGYLYTLIYNKTNMSSVTVGLLA